MDALGHWLLIVIVMVGHKDDVIICDSCDQDRYFIPGPITRIQPW